MLVFHLSYNYCCFCHIYILLIENDKLFKLLGTVKYNMEPEDKLIQERKEKLEKIREKGINPYPYRFINTHSSDMIHDFFENLKKEEESESVVKFAGRLMLRRVMGAAAFADLRDQEGKVQIYVRKNDVGSETYNLFKKLIDIGDFLGVEGKIFRTNKGELSIYVKKLVLLSKALRPLPEKYHGLQNPEIRYRQRYLDLIANPEVKETFILRSKILAAIREFLEARGFIEIDIPTLQPTYGGANAQPFKTHINAWDLDLFLSISPELYLKRAIIGGFEKVYYMGKNFRNEGVDRTHNPEFTMMECYWAYRDYNDIMLMTEDLFEYVCNKLFGTTKIIYQGKELNFQKPWKRLSMKDAIKEYADMDVDQWSEQEMKDIMEQRRIELKGEWDRDLAIEALFEELVEDKLIGPVFIIDHPKGTSPLCKVNRENKDLLERFEPYINTWEIGNAYSELNDPIKQKELFLEQEKRGRGGDEEAHKMDEDYVKAMEYGMPPCGGLGIGIDRMVMLLTNAKSVRDVIFFPTMKPEND